VAIDSEDEDTEPTEDVVSEELGDLVAASPPKDARIARAAAAASARFASNAAARS